MPSVISEATGIVICISPLAALDLYIETPNRQVNIKACIQHKELPSSHGETCFSDQFANDLSKPSLSQHIYAYSLCYEEPLHEYKYKYDMQHDAA